MKKKNNLYTRLLIAVLMMAMGSAVWAGTRTDVLTKEDFGTSTSYSEWGPKTYLSTAAYKGYCCGGTYSFRLKKDSPSCIITTLSGGTVKKITVTWHSSTDNNATLEVYGSNSAYTTTSAFHSSKETKVGTIVRGQTTSYTFTSNYKYIALCAASNSSVLYFEKIEIEWEDASYDPPKTITTTSFPKNTYSILFGETFEAPQATVSANEAVLSGATLAYSSSDPSVAEVNASTGAVNILKVGSTTITATYAGDETYQESSASYTLNIQESLPSTWTAASLGYTENTNVETVTNEGDLISITFAQGNGDKQPAYVLSSSAIENKTIKFERYNELSLAAKEGYAISGITIHYQSGSHTFTPSIGFYSVTSSTNDWIGTWTGCSPHVTLTNTSGVYLNIINITTSYIKLAEAGSVTVTDAGAATYCPTGGQPVVVGDGTLTQIITGVKDGVVIEENIPIVPSGTGVMLHGAGTYKCYTDSRLTEPTIATNYLVGETIGGYVPVGSYALQDQEEDGLGFYPVENEDYTPISAGKAYLTLPNALSANLRALFFSQEDADRSATAIQSPRFDSHSATTFYNLNGLPLKAPQKGINIMRKADGTIRKVVTP